MSFRLAEEDTTLAEGIAKAARLIDEGKALAVLEGLIAATNEVA